MGLKEDILGKLSGGTASGETLARGLGVTRAAVWKAVRSLKADGYDIAVTRRGYSLADDVPCAEGVAKHLGTEWKIESYRRVHTTMARAKELAEAGADRVAVIAEEQTEGHGRLGRPFWSPRGSGLYMSAVMRPGLRAAECGRITAYAAVAAARAVEALCGTPVSIKWVNDLFMNGRKVCGVLTEGGFGMESGVLDYAVIGIGINVKKSAFPQELVSVASDVESESGRRVNRCELAARVLDGFSDLPRAVRTGDFTDEYRRRSCVIGQRVRVNGEYDARVLGIADDCSLMLELDDGKRVSFGAGEISLRYTSGSGDCVRQGSADGGELDVKS